MLELDFEGWFQCRLATDPDPVDEPRGVSGWSFAVGDEPDLDRIIRFQGPVVCRSHAPAVGVRVRTVRVDGQDQLAHPLVGATVDLLDDPRFEGRNGLIAEDGREPIHPLRIEVSNGSITLRREDWLDCQNSAIGVVSAKDLERRCGSGLETDAAASIEVGAATTADDYGTWRAIRRAALVTECEHETDASLKAALKTRIWALDSPVSAPKLKAAFLFRVSYSLALGERGGRVEISGDPTAIGGDPVDDVPWSVDFWLGRWQADSMCGFVRGTLTVPFRRAED